MSRHPRLNDDDLYEVATYLAQPGVLGKLDPEIAERRLDAFEQEYAEATDNFPLDPDYFRVTDKQGIQLRIYFHPVEPVPPVVTELCDTSTPRPGHENQRRINHTNLGFQLCECGFVLGADQDAERITDFMHRRFPTEADP